MSSLLEWILGGAAAGVAIHLVSKGKTEKTGPKTYAKVTVSFYGSSGRRLRQPVNLFNATEQQAAWRARNALADLPDGAYAILAETGGGTWNELSRVRL